MPLAVSRKATFALILCACLLCNACSNGIRLGSGLSSTAAVGSVDGRQQRAATPDFSGLPGLPQERSASAEQIITQAALYAINTGGQIGFDPSLTETWLELQPGAAGSGFAWALYKFQPSGFKTTQIRVSVDTAYSGTDLWLAVSDYDTGTWKFLPPSANQGTQLAQAFNLPSGNLLSPTGQLYVVVLATKPASGSAAVHLHSIDLAYDDAVHTGTLSISGHVAIPAGFPGTLTINVDPQGTVVPIDASGNYVVPGLGSGAYGLTVQTDVSGGIPANGEVLPVYLNVNVAGADVTGKDFSIYAYHTVSGFVHNSLDQPIAGARVFAENATGPTAETFSDAAGNFSFPASPLGGGFANGMLGTLTASKPGYTFSQVPFLMPDEDEPNRDFYGTDAPFYPFSGTVRDQSNTPVAGVQVSVAYFGINTLTALDGTYTVMLSDGDYALSLDQPSTPSVWNLHVQGSQGVGVDFQTLSPGHSISGLVTQGSQDGYPGIVLHLFKGPTDLGTTSSDAFGNYGFGGLADGIYRVDILDYSDPDYRDVNVLGADVGNQNFNPGYTWGGHILQGGSPIEGTTVDLTATLGGPVLYSTVTDASGFYLFPHLPAGLYFFDPQHSTDPDYQYLEVVDADDLGVDFEWVP